MILSSFISAGVKAKALEEALKKNLKIDGWKLEVSRNRHIHFPAITVNIKGEKIFSSPEAIRSIIRKSTFSKKIKYRGLGTIDTLIMAEAKVHKVPLNGVHFHELNSIDTLVDVMGASACVEFLNIDKVISSSLNLGSAMPATLEIVKMKQLPVFSGDPSFEMTTPTGAAIISELADEFAEMPPVKIENYGFGSGTKKSKSGYSVMKVVIGETEGINYFDTDQAVLLETNIDDMDPRIYPYVMEKLFSAGAKDVWFTQVMMKKGRPGIILSALCDAPREKGLVNIIFAETTTLGIRRFVIPRYVLKRRIVGDKKIAHFSTGKHKIKSEFEVVKKKAIRYQQPLSDLLI